MASFTFLLVHCGSLVSTLVLSSETECPLSLQWSPTPVGMVRLVCSLERFPSGRLVSPMYTSAGSWSHVISYMTPHFLSFGVLSFWCTRMDRRVFTGLWYTITPCCLNVFDSLSDNPCPYGRAKEFVTTSEDQESELKHVHNALRTNGYTEWALVVPKQKPKTKPASTNKGNTRPPSDSPSLHRLKNHGSWSSFTMLHSNVLV